MTATADPQPSPAGSRSILVLGMHRSGTSLFGGILHVLGVTAPATLMAPAADNPRGFWESTVVATLNDALLQAAGSAWDDWRRVDPEGCDPAIRHSFERRMARTLETEFGRPPLFFLKDPRLSRLLPFWLPVLAAQAIAPSALIMVRHPAAVARSLARRNGFSQEHCLLLWLRHLLDAELSSRALPRAFVSYDSLLADWQGSLGRVAGRLGITWPISPDRARSAVAAVLERRPPDADTAAVQFKSAYAEVWTRHTWQALLDIEQTGDNPAARTTLDRVRSQFEDACRLFAPARLPMFRAAAPALHATAPDLRGVTLCAADSVAVALSARALRTSAARCSFADTVLFTDAAPAGPFRTCAIPRLASRDDYSGFILKDLARHIATGHVLVTQWDGFVVDPEAWENAFLDFDYVGARWGRFGDGQDVGNGGFSLRSRRLLEALQDPRFAPVAGVPEDELVCRTWRPLLERDYGIRFASPEIAELFSYERLWPKHRTFGFHGLFNFWRHLDDEGLADTATLLPPETLGGREFAELVALCFFHDRRAPLRSLLERWIAEASAEEIRSRLLPLLLDRARIEACLRSAGIDG